MQRRKRFRGLLVETLEARYLLAHAAGDEFSYVTTWGGDREYLVEAHLISESELLAQKELMGVAEEGVDYGVIVAGYGAGLRPPTEKEWEWIAANQIVVDQITPLPPPMAASGYSSQGDRAPAGGPPPSSIDWSATQYFPPIGSQGYENSCVAFAMGYYVKTFQEAKEHGWDLSGAVWEDGPYGHPSEAYQDKVFSPDFVYHQINRGGDNFTYFGDAARVIADIGAATWSTMPYSTHDHASWPSEDAWREAPMYRGSGGLANIYVGASVDALKTLLAGGNLGLMMIDLDEMHEMATLDNFENSGPNHAQTIVGYDDDLPYTEEGETRYGAFKVANSWGDWSNGGDGMWWISYEALQQKVGWVNFMEDHDGYNPETLAVFEIDHAVRGDTEVLLGMGPTGDPLLTKEFFSPGLSSDGDDPYPSNPVVLDITEFEPGDVEQFYLQVQDSGSANTGTVESFSVERYSD